MSDKGFEELLKLIKNVLPEGNTLPEITYEAMYKHGKPFITDEEEISLGTKMYNLYEWYMQMSRKEMNMFGVKYRDQNFFRGRTSSGCTSNFYITYTVDKPWTSLSSPFLFCKYHISLD